MCIAYHFEKYNAVITVLTPCKYVSPQMWPSTSGGRHETGGENGVGKEVSQRRGSDRQVL